jgi:hypothetical protein
VIQTTQTKFSLMLHVYSTSFSGAQGIETKQEKEMLKSHTLTIKYPDPEVTVITSNHSSLARNKHDGA